MRSNKLLVIVLLLLFVNAHSQEKLSSDPEERARQVTEWMKTNLNLSNDQAQKAEAVNYKCALKNIELEGNNKMIKATRQKYLTSNERYRDDQLKKIFTPEQFSTYQERKKEVMTKMMKSI